MDNNDGNINKKRRRRNSRSRSELRDGNNNIIDNLSNTIENLTPSAEAINTVNNNNFETNEAKIDINESWKPIYKWSVTEVKMLMHLSKLHSIINIIDKYNIDGSKVLELTLNELNNIIPDINIRNKFLSSIFAYTTDKDRYIIEQNNQSAFSKFYEDTMSAKVSKFYYTGSDLDSNTPSTSKLTHKKYEKIIEDLIMQNKELSIKNFHLKQMNKTFYKDYNRLQRNTDIMNKIKNKYDDLKIKYDKLKQQSKQKQKNNNNNSDSDSVNNRDYEIFLLKQKVKKLSKENKMLYKELNNNNDKEINALKLEIKNIKYQYEGKIDELKTQLTNSHKYQLNYLNDLDILRKQNNNVLLELNKYKSIFNIKNKLQSPNNKSIISDENNSHNNNNNNNNNNNIMKQYETESSIMSESERRFIKNKPTFSLALNLHQ